MLYVASVSSSRQGKRAQAEAAPTCMRSSRRVGEVECEQQAKAHSSRRAKAREQQGAQQHASSRRMRTAKLSFVAVEAHQVPSTYRRLDSVDGSIPWVGILPHAPHACMYLPVFSAWVWTHLLFFFFQDSGLRRRWLEYNVDAKA